ncbi:3-carboxy-cis,cis-muconate cycloisomerase OS=Streptomyces alboniger OX=132473 GN=pcaB PE=3 SV=1 [Streptomyces alboniger]
MTAAVPDAGLLAPGWAGSPAASTTGDHAFLQALLDAEAALTRALAARGLAPAEAATAVTEAADAGRFDVRSLTERARAGGNPVIPLVADLTKAVGEEHGPYVHRGATSQDIMDTATMLVAGRTLTLVLDDLGRTERALARLAAEHRDTAMPGPDADPARGSDHVRAEGGRLAVPGTGRAGPGGGRTGRSAGPTRGAAGTLAAFQAYGAADPAALPRAYARELGLRAPALPWHTLRTPIADLAGCLAFAAGALGKIAEDVLTLSRTEIAEVTEGSGGGSSAMPHKANPVRSTLVAAAARRAPQLAATLYGSLAAQDERPAGAWHAEWEPLRDLLRLVGGAARDTAELTEGLRVHADAMGEHLGFTRGLVVSERLSAELAPLLGRARAKELLTELARRTYSEHRTMRELLAEEPELTGLDLDALTDPTRYTGAAAALTDRALERR